MPLRHPLRREPVLLPMWWPSREPKQAGRSGRFAATSSSLSRLDAKSAASSSVKTSSGLHFASSSFSCALCCLSAASQRLEFASAAAIQSLCRNTALTSCDKERSLDRCVGKCAMMMWSPAGVRTSSKHGAPSGLPSSGEQRKGPMATSASMRSASPAKAWSSLHCEFTAWAQRKRCAKGWPKAAGAASKYGLLRQVEAPPCADATNTDVDTDACACAAAAAASASRHMAATAPRGS
mmetsp:Transcript_23934/g.80797  ORF Transcript_23934/g.80797 Transcript_23934/m.80797 type:complete len:237 (-) Transcript_23934:23-733(-)